MYISPSVTATVSLSASAGDSAAGDEGGLAAALLEGAAADVSAVGVPAAGVSAAAPPASPSPEHPATRPIPRARTSAAAARRGERAGAVGSGTRTSSGRRRHRPDGGSPLSRDAPTLMDPAE